MTITVDQLHDRAFHVQAFEHWRRRLTPEQLADAAAMVREYGVDTALRAILKDAGEISEEAATMYGGFLIYLATNSTFSHN